MKNKGVQSIIRVAVGTGLLLLVPLVAMQFTNEVNWTGEDFIAAGILLAVVGLLGELIWHKVENNDRRLAAIIALGILFLYLWAELAVGIFTNWGS